MSFDEYFDNDYDIVELHVECARCGKKGTSFSFIVEEGDEWECPECWERCEAKERENEIQERRKRSK